jgi:predicted RNA-binding Zn-ribbon protein involved in translation (DUF1610 family)
MPTPKILLFDIETTYMTIGAWRPWNTDALKIIQDYYVLCYSYKWYGESTIKVNSLIDYGSYKKDKTNDKNLLKDLWDLIDQADAVMAHNGDRFDIKKVNARFLEHGFGPYSPVRQIDTLKMLRRHFGFSSNKLDYIAQKLGVGAKTQQAGKLDMWSNCMAGNETREQRTAWKNMKKYAKQDIVLLEGVFDKIKPWCSFMNMGLLVDDTAEILGCPKCGEENKLIKRGYSYTDSGAYHRYQCKSCGGYSRGRYKIKGSGNPVK